MSSEKWSNSCPTCMAQPGEQCSQPTNENRRPVNWEHHARVDARYLDAPRNTRVRRHDAATMQGERVISAEYDVNPTNTNVWALTEDEARKLGMQLLDVAGITPEMIEAFRSAWLGADTRGEKGRRIRAGLTAAMRTNTTASE